MSDLFINERVKEIERNQLSEAVETLNKISPAEDDRFVQEIVQETLKESDLELLHLLEFLESGFGEILLFSNK